MASGNTLKDFMPMHNEPPASNFMTPDTRNGHPVLDANDAANESAVFSAVMPQHYSGGGVTARVGISMSSATTGDVDIDIAFERVGAAVQDVDSDGFVTAKSSDNNTVPGTSGHLMVVSIAFTDGAEMGGIQAGEKFRMRVTRDAANDTAVGDTEIHFVELRET